MSLNFVEGTECHDPPRKAADMRIVAPVNAPRFVSEELAFEKAVGIARASP